MTESYKILIESLNVLHSSYAWLHGISLLESSDDACAQLMVIPATAFLEFFYTGWPRKNATALIVNFKNIVDETELFFILFGRTFIFQQNDTMIINLGYIKVYGS